VNIPILSWYDDRSFGSEYIQVEKSN